MSKSKQIIDRLIQTTKIDTRYNRILNLYETNSVYPKLVYHTTEHVRAVLNLFEILRKLSNKQFDKTELELARTALAYHDIGHSGLPDTEQFPSDVIEPSDVTNNIGVAMTIVLGHAPANAVSICNYLGKTSYPHTSVLGYQIHSGLDPELVNLMRDADMLWGMLPNEDNAARCLFGIEMEQQAVGFKPRAKLDVEALLIRQLDFIRNYEPFSSAGRMFKNAMFQQASEQWALIAVKFMRQEEMAKAVDAMEDAEVLKLYTAMKKGVRQMSPQESREDPAELSDRRLSEVIPDVDCAATYPSSLRVHELLSGESV